MPTPNSPRAVPKELGPYRLLTCLGEGGFAPVWHAEEAYEGKKLRDVAIKLFFLPDGIAASSDDAGRWLDNVIDEARALCRVEHGNIVRFHTLYRDDAMGIVGLVMEYVAGKNLGAILRKSGPLGEQKVLEVGISIAWALAALHNAGLVHRDVKPENVIDAASGYKLIDFGIVCEAPSDTTKGASIPLIGTPGYIAPEIRLRRAPPSPAGDLYALGATLFMLSTGRVYQPLARSLSESSGPMWRDPSESASLSELTQLLLDPDPNTRPRHADWVAHELERLHALLGGSAATGAGSIAPGKSVLPKPNKNAIPTGSESAAGDQDDADGEDPVPSEQRRATTATLAHLSTEVELHRHPPLIGRESALRTLERAAREAHLGNVRFVLVTGPLGVGRTRLLDAAIKIAGIAAGRTLRMHGSPERQSPLRPLTLGLRALEDKSAFRLLESAIERALSPAMLPATGQADDALEAIEDALVVTAKDEPILLSLDDAQWADERTLKLLQLLIEQTSLGPSAKLLVVAAARDEPHASPPLRALLTEVKRNARAGVTHVALGPLTQEQAAKVAQGVCPIERNVERAVVRGSGCVPFFLVNALLAWQETGAIEWRSRAFHASDPELLRGDFPGVGALVEARLASYFPAGSALSRVAFRVLSAVALYGDGLPIGSLFHTCGDDKQDEDVERTLETLVDASILVASGYPQEYGFAQEMVRQAVLNLVRQKPWFQRLHRRLLDTIAKSPDSTADAAFLATGYEKLGAREEARSWLRRAMARATHAGLFAEAAGFGDRLAALAEGPSERADAVLGSVRALLKGRQIEEAKLRLERFEGLDPIAKDVRWRIRMLEVARARSEIMDDPELLADTDALADPILACEARMALAGVAPPGEQAIALIGEAISLAERLDPALELSARVLRAELLYAAELRDPRLAERDLERALAIARAISSVWNQVHIESDLAVLEVELGRLSAAIERLRRLAEQAETLGMRGQLRMLLNNLSVVAMREGRFDEAAEVAGRTAKLAAEAGDPTLRGNALSLRADAHFCAGDLDTALAIIDEADELQRERDDRARALTLLRRADILSAMGRDEEALEEARAAQESASLHCRRAYLLTAILWEKLYQARRGETTAEDLTEALDAAKLAGVGQRPVRPRLIEEAAAWLANATAPITV